MRTVRRSKNKLSAGAVRRDDVGRIHYSCDGTTDLLSSLPGEMLRVGDTATAQHRDSGDWLLLRVDRIVRPHGALWGIDDAWTDARASERIEAADIVVLVDRGGWRRRSSEVN